MSTPRDVDRALERLDEHVDEALQFEDAAADRAADPTREDAADLSQWLAQTWQHRAGGLDQPLQGRDADAVLADLVGKMGSARVDARPALRADADAGRALGERQARRETGGRGRPGSARRKRIASRMDDATRLVVNREPVDLGREATNLLRGIEPRRFDDVQPVVALVHQTAIDLEAASRWSTNRSINTGTAAVATAVGAGRLWIAERDACVVCLAYSGQVAEGDAPFPPDLTFGARTPREPWPDGILVLPPRHPRCRCRVTPYAAADTAHSPEGLPEALQREARRSIVKGWALESEPDAVRRDAAARLLARGAELPKTVQTRARKAVKAPGRFKTPVPGGAGNQ